MRSRSKRQSVAGRKLTVVKQRSTRLHVIKMGRTVVRLPYQGGFKRREDALIVAYWLRVGRANSAYAVLSKAADIIHADMRGLVR